MDETCLSCGGRYAIVTTPKGHGKKGTLVAMIRGTKSEDVIKVLVFLTDQQVFQVYSKNLEGGV